MSRSVRLTFAFLFAIACFIEFCVISSVDACTGIRLKSEDGSVIFGRTGEFGVDLKAGLLIVPRGLAMDGGDLPEGVKPLAWKSKYGAAGTNTHGSLELLDGLNEKGLAVGAFYFPDYAEYAKVTPADSGKVVSPLNLANYLLTNFATVAEVRKGLAGIKVAGAYLKEWGGVPPFHWIVHDQSGACIVVEPVGGKLAVHDNPTGCMSNSPTFDWHLTNLRNFIHLSPLNVPAKKIEGIEFKQLGQGSGLAGMPGDFTPPSRFIRAVVYAHTHFPIKSGREAVLEMFHALNQFDIPKGAAVGKHGNNLEADITQATVVSDLKGLKYYAHNYASRRIKMIDLRRANLNAERIVQVDLPKEESIEDVTPTK